MIEKIYGHILTPDIVSSIRKTTAQTSSDKGERSYQF